MIAKEKDDPNHYPRDVLRVFDALSLGGKRRILGSSGVRSQLYAGDYDLNEKVQPTPSGLRSVLERLQSLDDTFVGDIKLGEVPEWRILSPTARVEDGKVMDFNATQSQRVVDRLRKEGVLTPAEANDAEKLLRIRTPTDFLRAKDTLKYHILRWTPTEIRDGKKEVRGKVVSLEDALQSRGVKKIDVIAKDGDRFTDYSIVYDDGRGHPFDLPRALQEDIYYYLSTNQPFKALKRRFALAKYQKDEKTLAELTPILNSDLGRLYRVISDVGTLLSLLNHKGAPLGEIRAQLDRIRASLGNIYTLRDYLRDEPNVLGTLNALLRLPPSRLPKALTSFQSTLQRFLADNTRRFLYGLKGGSFPVKNYEE